MYEIKRLLMGTIMLFTSIAYAETVYVTDELEIGLHTRALNDSPIIKLVQSGTPLNVIIREGDLVQVEDPEGVQGWVNNKYLLTHKSDKAQITQLEKEIEGLKPSITQHDAENGNADKQQLIQQLNAERLLVVTLKEQMAQLQTELEAIKPDETHAGASVAIDFKTVLNHWKQYLLIALGIITLGIIIGVYLYDYFSRRRHGGFRI